MRAPFIIEIHAAAGHGFIEIDFITVEVRSVNTGKFYYPLAIPVQRQTAAAAHAGTVDHDRIHGNGHRNTKRLRGGNYEFHHDQWSDGDDHIELFAGFQHFLERHSDVAVAGIGAVIGHYNQFVGAGMEFIFKDQQIFRSETDDAGNFSTQAMEFLSNGHRDRAADTAPTIQTFLIPSVCVATPRRPAKS